MPLNRLLSWIILCSGLAIGKMLNDIHDKDMFNKRLSVSKYVSVLMYRDGTVEVHISIEEKLSTYESWKNPNYIRKENNLSPIFILGHEIIIKDNPYFNLNTNKLKLLAKLSLMDLKKVLS